MNDFIFSYPTKVYFGKDALKKAAAEQLDAFGSNVLLAYGGGSVKRNGIYDEVMQVLKEHGKHVVEFSGIMSNPTYAKVQEGARLAKENKIDFILAVGGGKRDRLLQDRRCTGHERRGYLGDGAFRTPLPAAGHPDGRDRHCLRHRIRDERRRRHHQ